ncbi:MAG: hypothetical protein JXR80_09840 [Deltaproteobacteria bacterium]|nr:hypothetical protein [Deltaproteobacteria bacterium]
MATIAHPDSQKLCQQNINSKIAEIKKLLTVIEKGGTAEHETALNLPQRDSLITSLTYTPIGHQRYNLEIINLRPELVQIEEKLEQLAPMLEQRYLYTTTHNQSERLKTIDKIKEFLKEFSPFFDRSSENANQLLLNSAGRLAKIENYSLGQHSRYYRLEILLQSLIIILIMTLSFFLLRRAAAVNLQLREEISARSRLEKRLRGYQSELELEVRERTVELTEDIKIRKEVEKQLRDKNIEHEKLIGELETALEQVKTLAGIVPICMYCKKIRDDQGYWNQLEKFISEHSDAEFSHGICPECYPKVMQELEDELNQRQPTG